MAQGKMKVKNAGKAPKHQKSLGSIKKNKGKISKGRKVFPAKKKQADLNNMKKNFQKMLQQKVETDAVEKVAVVEPRSLKFVQ